MGVQAVVAAVAAVATVAGTAVSITQSQSAAKDAKKARALEGQRQENQERRRRRQEIRRARIARAQTVNVGSQVGATGSSALAGGTGSVSSQLGSSLGFSDQQAGLARQISSLNQSSADKQSLANLGGSVAGLGLSAFNSADGFETLSEAFS